MPATAVKRGCGTRVKGGIYSEVGLDSNGVPLERFLVDPPQRIDVETLGVSPVGVTLIERGGAWHVLDWVGSTHYPNVADFVEEVRRFGMSRRLPKTLDFSKLTKASKHLLLHARGWITNWKDYARTENAESAECPKTGDGGSKGVNSLIHTKEGMCARFWWQDVDNGPVFQASRSVRRAMPSFEYAAQRPEVGVKAEYEPAIFLVLPIERLAVVRDPEGRTHEQAVEAAKHSGLQVTLESE